MSSAADQSQMLFGVTDIEFNSETSVADPVGSPCFHVQVLAEERQWPDVSGSGRDIPNTVCFWKSYA